MMPFWMAACTARKGDECEGKGAARGSGGGGIPGGPLPEGGRRRARDDAGFVDDCGAGGGRTSGDVVGVNFCRVVRVLLLLPPPPLLSLSALDRGKGEEGEGGGGEAVTSSVESPGESPGESPDE